MEWITIAAKAGRVSDSAKTAGQKEVARKYAQLAEDQIRRILTTKPGPISRFLIRFGL